MLPATYRVAGEQTRWECGHPWERLFQLHILLHTVHLGTCTSSNSRVPWRVEGLCLAVEVWRCSCLPPAVPSPPRAAALAGRLCSSLSTLPREASLLLLWYKLVLTIYLFKITYLFVQFGKSRLT